jgi:hypothetical protein
MLPAYAYYPPQHMVAPYGYGESEHASTADQGYETATPTPSNK